MPDDPIRTPTFAAWLDNVALRDLALHQHSACVDARGDVYQWGDGFFESRSDQTQKPKLTLRGKVRDFLNFQPILFALKFPLEHQIRAADGYPCLRSV